MKLSFVFFSAILFLLITYMSCSKMPLRSSDAIECRPGIALRCLCPASMQLGCGDIRGQVLEDVKVAYLKVDIINLKTKEKVQEGLILHNPQDALKDYVRPNLLENAWVATMLQDKISSNKEEFRVVLDSLGMPPATVLYKDPFAKEVFGTLLDLKSKK